MADLLKLCEETKMIKRFDQVSLGQGQGPKAEALIKLAMDRGMWVCLQNCHLAQSFMPRLENIVENIDPDKVGRCRLPVSKPVLKPTMVSALETT